jgi:hypothetical protein
MRTALSSMVANTGFKSPGDALMIRKTSCDFLLLQRLVALAC